MSITGHHSAVGLAANGEPATVPPAWRLIEMIHGARVTQVVAATAELGIIDQLREGSRTVADLAEATGTHPDSLHRLLRAAAALELVHQPRTGEFAATPLGEYLRTGPGTLRDLALSQASPGTLRPYERLSEAVRSGASVATAALGQGFWDYYKDHSEEGARFAGAMSGVSAAVADEVSAALDVTGHRRIVDVGGGHGTLLANLLRAAPQATGVLFDLPEVIAGVQPNSPAARMGDRIELVAGDFLAQVPDGGDTYVLAHVLHNWDDELAGRILAHCHRAAALGATLAVVEMVLPAESESGPGHRAPYLVDLAMLVNLGGRERTQAQFQTLLGAAGWALTSVTALSGGHGVLTARRR